jgi:hypothetical protein
MIGTISIGELSVEDGREYEERVGHLRIYRVHNKLHTTIENMFAKPVLIQEFHKGQNIQTFSRFRKAMQCPICWHVEKVPIVIVTQQLVCCNCIGYGTYLDNFLIQQCSIGP